MTAPPAADPPLEPDLGDEPGPPLHDNPPAEPPASAEFDTPPSSWLFAPSSLGQSFRLYLPTILAMRLLGLVRMFLFAWLILKTEYGLQRLALQWINLLSAIARFGVPAGIERYAPAYEHVGQLGPFIRRSIWLSTLLTATLTLLLAAGAPWLARLGFSGSPPFAGELPPSPGYLVELTLACLLVTLILSIYLNIQGALRGLRMYRALAAMEVLHGLTFLLFGVVALLLGGNLELAAGRLVKLHGAAVALTVAYGASLLVTTVWIGLGLSRHLRRWTAQHRPMDLSFGGATRQLLRFSGYMTGPNVLWMLFIIFGLWYLNKLFGQAEVGLLAASRDIMQTVQLLAMAVWPTAQNSANRLWETGLRQQAVAQLGMVFRLSGWPLWVLSAVLVLARPYVELALPPEYLGMARTAPWLAMMFMWMIHLSLPTAYAYLLTDSRALLIAAVAGLATHAGSAIWLVRRWHAVGAAQSAALGAAAALCALLWLVNRRREQPWLAGRDVPLLLAPLLLAAPTAWRAGGDYLLTAGLVTAVVLIAMTDWLWSRSDRAAFSRYVAASVRAVFRRPHC